MIPACENKGNEALARILDRLLDGILVVNKEGKIRYANSAACKLFSKSAADLEGQDFGFIAVPQQIQEIQILQDQRIRFAQMLASEIEWEGRQAMLISLRDVTDLKKGEVALQVERQKLEQSNIELSQYASMASHDLREPVRKVRFYAHRILDKYADELGEEPRKLTERIYSAAQRLGAIIDGIAKFSTAGTGLRISMVNLNQVISQIIEDLEILIVEKKVVIEAGELTSLQADAGLLYQLFLNLITNSVKYARPDATPVIRITGKPAEDTFQIIFQDNGLGFDNTYATTIFEPFRRLHTEGYDGTGIGLAICKKVVDAHQGRIWAESTTGEGTRFFIELPKKQSQVQKPAGK